MGKFRITTTDRQDGEEDRATSCAIPGPEGADRVGPQRLSCAIPRPEDRVDTLRLSCDIDTPGYGREAKDISPLADGESQG